MLRNIMQLPRKQVLSKTCSDCTYWRSLQIVDASAIADPKTVPVKDLQFWCSNSKSSNFRFKDTPFEQFVMGENTCVEWTQRGKKAPILQRIMTKGLAGLKLSRNRLKIPCVLWIIALLVLLGCSMEMTVLYLFMRGLL
jgi:hypothetical protein